MRGSTLFALMLFVGGAGVPAQQASVSHAETPRVLHVGGNIKPPVILSSVDPEYSEEAREAKFSGTVEVYLWVDSDGNPSHIRVAKGVGMGLNENAVDAIRQYKFRPATLDGKPVTVDLYIDVKFEIVHKRVVIQRPE